MENKKGNSIVTNVTAVGTWNGMFKFQYDLADGTSLTAMHKENKARFAVGANVDYEITNVTQYGYSGKLSSPQAAQAAAPKGGKSYGAAKKQTWAESMAITKDACLGAACEFFQKFGGASVAEVTALSDRFVNFVTYGTPAQDFDMWSAVHKNLIHRNSAVKSAVKIASSADECIKVAMELIKYIDKPVQMPVQQPQVQQQQPAPQPVQQQPFPYQQHVHPLAQQQVPPPTAPMVSEDDDLPF